MSDDHRETISEYGRFAAGVGFRVLGVFVSVASAIITSRGLGVYGRGILFTCTSAAQIAAQLLAFGMPSAVVLAVAPNPGLARQGIRRAVAASAAAGLAAFVISGLLVGTARGEGQAHAVIELSPVVAGMAATQILLWWSSALTQAVGAVDRLPLVELVYRTITTGWAATALFVLKVSFAVFLGSIILADAICGAAWLIYVRSLAPAAEVPPPWPPGWVRWSLKAYLPLNLYSGMRRADALLLTGLGGARATGLYSIAIQVMDISQIAPVFLGQKAMFTFSAGRTESHAVQWIRRLLPVSVALSMILAGFTARLWAPLLFGAEFSGVGPILLALAAGGGALAWETVAVQEVNAAGFPLRLTVAWLACFGVAVALLVVMIPEFGATGAAAAVSVSYLVLAVLVHRLRARVRRRA